MGEDNDCQFQGVGVRPGWYLMVSLYNSKPPSMSIFPRSSMHGSHEVVVLDSPSGSR